MTGPGTSAEDRYAALVAEMVLEPDVERSEKRGFGSSGLWTAGQLFAFLSRGWLVVKLPAARVDALVAGGSGERWDPGHGRRMREWLALRPETTDDWKGLASEAKAFVRSGR